MSFPTPESEESMPAPAARRRRRRQFSVPSSTEEQAQFLSGLVQRVTPTFDFYLFTIMAGLALALAIIIDAPAFFVLAALMAPFMGPVVGIALTSLLGSGRRLAQMLGAIFMGGLIIFAWGALIGWLVRLWPELTFTQVAAHARFSWPDVLLLALGAAVTVYALVRAPQQRPLVGSVALAYELYLPLGAAGFGLTAGQPALWPEGLVLFVLHLFLATLIAALVLAALRLRPVALMGYVFGGLLTLAAIGALLLAFAALPPAAGQTPEPLATAATGSAPGSAQAATFTPTDAPAPQTATPSLTPEPTRTRTPTNTLVPSRVPSATITPEPTPVWAYISADQGGGALIREEPSFDAKLTGSLINGVLVQVLPDMVEAGNVTWVKIRMDDGREGWIVRSLLVTATPSPGW